MPAITVDKLIAYARSLPRNTTLHTILRRQASPYRVNVTESGLQFVPLSSARNTPTSFSRKKLENMCKKFSKNQSFKTQYYRDAPPAKTGASYFLPLVIKYLASLVDEGPGCA